MKAFSSDKFNNNTLITVLVFAAVFAIVGWTIPVIVATYTPVDQQVTVESFEVNNASIEEGQHGVCIGIDAAGAYPIDNTRTLELISTETGAVIAVDQSYSQRALQDGHQDIYMYWDLPNDLEPGKYKYHYQMTIHLADGRVQKAISEESNEFRVTENTVNESISNLRCSAPNQTEVGN